MSKQSLSNEKNLKTVTEEIKNAVKKGSYYYSANADLERKGDNLTLREIERVIYSSEIIDAVPRTNKGPRYYLLGYHDDLFVHVMCGTRDDSYVLLLASPPKLTFQETC